MKKVLFFVFLLIPYSEAHITMEQEADILTILRVLNDFINQIFLLQYV